MLVVVTHIFIGTALACIPLHGVEAEEQSITMEQTQPHEDIACTLVTAWHKDERNCTTQQPPTHTTTRINTSIMYTTHNEL